MDNEILTKIRDKAEWAPASAGDGGVFTVRFSADENMNIIVDKTFAEVEAAYNAGKFVRGVLDGGEMENPLIVYSKTKGYIMFKCIFPEEDRLTIYNVIYYVEKGMDKVGFQTHHIPYQP